MSILSSISNTPARRRLAAGMMAAALTAASLASAPLAAAYGGDGLRAEANKYRVNGGLAPVAGTDLLDDIATQRANEMVAGNKLEHNLAYVKDRLNKSKTCWTALGEIIAWERGYPEYSYARTSKQWWDSPGHHAIMMGSGYNAAGGAWATASDGGHYSVMVFLTLCSAPQTLAISPLQVKMPYDPARTIVFKAGTYTGLQLSSDGAVLGSKTYTLSRNSSAPGVGRSWVNGKVYYLISAGIWSGYWVQETSKTYVLGIAWSSAYDPARTMLFAAGTTTGYKYDVNGHVTARRSYTLTRASSAPTGAVASINGRKHYYITAGIWAGYWVPASSGMYLR